MQVGDQTLLERIWSILLRCVTTETKLLPSSPIQNLGQHLTSLINAFSAVRIFYLLIRKKIDAVSSIKARRRPKEMLLAGTVTFELVV